MDPKIAEALKTDKTIDITTTGRKSGQPRRIEIWFHNVDDRLYITGQPGKRDWFANLLANPDFTFHLKGSVEADIPATAHNVVDLEQRRVVILAIYKDSRGEDDIQGRIDNSPLVEVSLKL
ncbi:MAG: DUF385 domain-containing protein [Chloroflexi bacterium]|nr:MAG: DUF385 domain-containing protein [Chloroflexota bacterium]MBL1197346.1 DUF385 domain-containing protein [Chloroflexota bacterium]NOH14643.1 nitroreductase family deazaflavin-dependent oxidoreductase [Chloroflexota bacterium]